MGAYKILHVTTYRLYTCKHFSTGSHRQGDTIWISNLKKGGIASRMGMLQSGDMLLAINGESLENATLRDAAKMLRNAGNVVTLTVSKESGE